MKEAREAKKTPVACIVGWPVKHARSPVIHRFWLREYGVEGDYRAEPVEPAALAGFFDRMRGGAYVGGNVTVPHKEGAFAAMDEVDASAAAIGAVNTVWREDGRLFGASTDGHGFLASLDQGAPGWSADPGPAVILGAGGAARAVIGSLLDRGFGPLHLVNRTAGRAEALAGHFGAAVRPAVWESLPNLMSGARILVNATSLGMQGQPAMAIDLTALPEDCLVTDLVYVPLETGLLGGARRRGLRTVDGLGMLLHQAVPGFERWFGLRPEVTPALRDAVLRDIIGSAR